MKKEGWVLFAALALPQRTPDIFIKGFHLVESDQSQRSLEIISQNAAHFKEEKLTQLGEINAQIWSKKKGSRPFKINGRKGVFHSPSASLEIRENSQVITPDQYLFISEVFFYDGNKRTITSNEKVLAHPLKEGIKSSEVLLSGMGVEIDLEKNQYIVKSQSEAIQKQHGKAPLVIRSQQASIKPQQKVIEFIRSVRVRGDNLRMNGDRLLIFLNNGASDVLAKEMHMKSVGKKSTATVNNLKIQSNGIITRFDTTGGVSSVRANGEVNAETDDGTTFRADELDSELYEGKERLVLRGGVDILSKKKSAKGEIAYYYPDKKEFVVEKGASVVQGSQQLQGERIRFWNDGENQKVLVEKASGTLKKDSITD